jgi:hypothetical protein
MRTGGPDRSGGNGVSSPRALEGPLIHPAGAGDVLLGLLRRYSLYDEHASRRRMAVEDQQRSFRTKQPKTEVSDAG